MNCITLFDKQPFSSGRTSRQKDLHLTWILTYCAALKTKSEAISDQNPNNKPILLVKTKDIGGYCIYGLTGGISEFVAAFMCTQPGTSIYVYVKSSCHIELICDLVVYCLGLLGIPKDDVTISFSSSEGIPNARYINILLPSCGTINSTCIITSILSDQEEEGERGGKEDQQQQQFVLGDFSEEVD